MMISGMQWDWHVFFFQAEEGIRTAQESRGLGEVYKRQQEKQATKLGQLTPPPKKKKNGNGKKTVPYKHLTMPTKREWENTVGGLIRNKKQYIEQRTIYTTITT